MTGGLGSCCHRSGPTSVVAMTTIAFAVAVLTWAGTAAAAGALDRRGRTGSAEKVLRSLAYRS
jgi:hypothetical protein